MTINLGKTRVLYLVIAFILTQINVWDTKAQESIRFKTIVIDAGHGGRDPGAVGSICKEKDIVLNVSLKLGKYIKQYMPDVKVVYTRSRDVFIPLNRRAEIANENKADLFVSIHANYVGMPNIYGAETFVLGLHRTKENLEVAKKENSVITLEEDYTTKYEGFDPTSTESYIIFELMQNIHIDQSIHMASLVQDQFTHRVGRRNRGVKQAGFLVLRKAAMPSVLVELGFLSNRKEEKFIASEEGQTYMASALFRAVRDYKKEFDSKSKMEDIAQKAKMINADNSIKYRIQVASSKRAIKKSTGIYKKLDDVWMFQQGGRYKYTSGEFNKFKDAVNGLDKVREKIEGAFVVAFENDKPIALSKAKQLERK